MNNINSDEVRAFRIPLPPLAEQREIVRRVERLFALADQLEARMTQAQAHVARLKQSLLGKAFRGELVPTEADLARREVRQYETAAALLERIREARSSANHHMTGNRHRKTSKRGNRRLVTARNLGQETSTS